MRTLLVLVLLVAGGAALWVLSAPQPLPASALPTQAADLANGEAMFWAGGCYACHAGADDLAAFDPAFGPLKPADIRLGGGKPLATPAGTFYPPNISPDARQGIGGWTTIAFVNAMTRGIAPGGDHLYPAFPYLSYQRMALKDVVDLKAFLDTLPAVATVNRAPDLFPLFSFRRGIGLWKRLFLDGKAFAPDGDKSAEINRGAYLVAGPGHCNECHTRRILFGRIGLAALDSATGLGFFGGPDEAHALAGAPNPAGTGKPVPNITPGKDGLEGDAKEIADRLLFGQLDGDMAEVQKDLVMLEQVSPGAVEAIAAYLADLPPQATTR